MNSHKPQIWTSSPQRAKLGFLLPIFLVLSSCGGDTEQSAPDEPDGSDLSFYSISAVEDSFESGIQEFEYPESGPEVFFGTEVTLGHFLETALIIPRVGSSRMCTGVLIAPDVVLTARHCRKSLVAKKGSLVIFGDNGATTLGEENVTARFKTKVAETSLFPKERAAADIMLLRLEEAAPDFIKPTLLASEGDIAAASLARIVGFGVTENETRGRKVFSDVGVVSPDCTGVGTYQGATKERMELYGCVAGAELVAGLVQEVVPKCSIALQIQECHEVFSLANEDVRRDACTITAIRNREFANQEFQICSDTCNGDSGGPLFVAPAASADRWDKYNASDVWVGTSETDDASATPPAYRLAAVTSRAVDTDFVKAHRTPVKNRKCGNGGIYTLLTNDRIAWVNETLDAWSDAERSTATDTHQ